MLLDQGPWLPLELLATPPTPEPSILHDNAVSATAEIDNSDAITEQYYQTMTNAIGTGGELAADGDAQIAEWGLEYERTREWDGGLDQAQFNRAQLDADAQQVEREIPPEAYFPAPGDPPLYDSRQTFTIEATQNNGDDDGVIIIEPPKTYNATVGLLNLDKPGLRDFDVGDRFRVVIHGAPNSPVRVESTRDSDLFPSTYYGETDGAGNFTLEGTQDAASQGVWVEKWFVGTAVAFPILNFIVR